MTDKEIDVRGLSCPEPVLRTKMALMNLPAGGVITVRVETVTSRENVLRSVRALGHGVEVAAAGDDEFVLTITKA